MESYKLLKPSMLGSEVYKWYLLSIRMPSVITSHLRSRISRFAAVLPVALPLLGMGFLLLRMSSFDKPRTRKLSYLVDPGTSRAVAGISQQVSPHFRELHALQLWGTMVVRGRLIIMMTADIDADVVHGGDDNDDDGDG